MKLYFKKGNGHRGTIKNIYLILHGTELIPEHLKYGQRKYKQEDVIKDTLDPTPVIIISFNYLYI